LVKPLAIGLSPLIDFEFSLYGLSGEFSGLSFSFIYLYTSIAKSIIFFLTAKLLDEFCLAGALI
jgi:hypothetical protein